MDYRLHTPMNIMRVAIGLMATLAGLDKFFNILADWGNYVSPVAAQLLPFSTDALMWIVGVVEFAVGISILTAILASPWCVRRKRLVAARGRQPWTGGHLDIAVRDVVLSISAFTLARLVQVRDEFEVREKKREPMRHRSIA